jgi:hypothetical protein
MRRMHGVIGPFAFSMLLMNRPNIHWGIQRGYWDTIDRDWHWTIRIFPDICLVSDDLRAFDHATGSKINPIFPEMAADYLRASSG